jgi:L-threonylcarbamoyladenylate synthase
VGVLVGPGELGSDRGRTFAARPDRIHVREWGPNTAASARDLYATLRELDRDGVDRILVRALASDEGLGLAVADRLRRAAAGRIVNS